MDKPLWMWVSFIAVVLTLLLLDLGIFNKNDHEIGVKESLKLSAFYIVIALLFGVWLRYSLGEQRGNEYFTGYLVEKSLSIDNIFVISMIFTYLNIPRIYQHRVLFWGIIGVIVFRGIMIAIGATLIASYAWILLVFAAFLIFTGFKMLYLSNKNLSLENNYVLQIIRKYCRITPQLHGHDFIIQLKDSNSGKTKIWITPLLVALILIEFADVMFAFDSVPAIFALTSDTFIVYTSNIFAILGLRALYFALDAILYRFAYLKYALSLVLIFIGSKVFAVEIFGWEKFPIYISLSVTSGLIALGIIYSVYKTRG